jgi:O-methyltransferase involved in polyketide biosynthesis
METTPQANPNSRDFSTISPSAKSLLLLKGATTIPFAREAAGLISAPEKYIPDFASKDIAFWATVFHFENRYWSIDQLLGALPVKNILELSSGFSFRGLDAIKQPGVHYIDTDLPNIITVKKDIITALQVIEQGAESKLETLPLNALDENSFTAITDRFADGPIVIVNEGLLVYLNNEEKEQLCSIIHKILSKHGGYWITADVYVKGGANSGKVKLDGKLQHFFEQHHIEDNKFASFEAAENFFKKAGFVIDKEAQPDHSKLTSLKYLRESATPGQLSDMGNSGKAHATWQLKPAMR